jgi:cilia- and flagella-associated protein 52
MLDGAEEGDINTLAITKTGENFVSGGGDKLVKLWGYDDGMCYYNGVGHSGSIVKVTFFNLARCFSRLKIHCFSWI